MSARGRMCEGIHGERGELRRRREQDLLLPVTCAHVCRGEESTRGNEE